MPPLVLERVEVGSDFAEALVHASEPRFMRTSAVPGLAANALALLPGLARHRCDCGSAHGIEHELEDTESPHLLEHVALELMALSGSPRSLGGNTSWDFHADGRGFFRVRIGHDSDLVVLAALECALAVVNALLTGAALPDIDRKVAELRALRERQPGR